MGWGCVKNFKLVVVDGLVCEDFFAFVLEKMKSLEAIRDDMEVDLWWSEMNMSELVVFILYVFVFLNVFLVFVDMYNVL